MGKDRKVTDISEQKRILNEAENKQRTVRIATLMDICHLKHSELEPKYQNYKGRVVLRGDVVNDDLGVYPVITEQESSASETAAAMDGQEDGVSMAFP